MSSEPRTMDVLAEPQWSQAHDAYHTAVDEHIDETKRITAARDMAHTMRPAVDRSLEGVTYATAGPLASEVRGAVAKVQSVAEQAWSKAAHMRVNDTVAKGGRDRVVRETVTEARTEVERLADAAETQVLVARAELELQAVGKVSPQREAFARQDAETTLGGRTDVGSLRQLAHDQDPDVRALVAGPWGYRRIRAQASSDEQAQELHRAVREIALDTARKVGSPEQQRAAEGLGAMTEALKAVQAARAQARMTLKGFSI
jgi:hypothetical protein